MTKSQKKISKRTAIVVLGMHRTGTSALTGMLNLLGCANPKTLMPGMEQNPKGFFESLEVAGLNDRIFKAAGTHWSKWDALADWLATDEAQAFVPEAKTVLRQEYGRKRLIAIKDPRICRLTRVWMGALDSANIEGRFVHTLRNPLEVAQSLGTRNAFGQTHCMLLWLRYLLDAERATRGRKRVFTSYDVLLKDWREIAGKIDKAFGLGLPIGEAKVAARIDDFLTPNLRHFRAAKEANAETDTPIGWIWAAYDILWKWAETGEVAADRKKLDRIREALDFAGPVLQGFVSTEAAPQAARGEAQESEDPDAGETQDDMHEADSEAGSQGEEHPMEHPAGAAVAELDALKSEREAERQKRTAQESEDTQRDAKIDELSKQLADEKAERAKAEAGLAEEIKDKTSALENAAREAEAAKQEMASQLLALKEKLVKQEQLAVLLREDLESRKERFGGLEAQIFERDNKIEQLNTALRVQKAQTQTVENTIEMLRAQRSGYDEQIATLEASLRQRRAELDAAYGESQGLRQTLQETEARLQAVQNEQGQARQAAEAEAARLAVRIAELEERAEKAEELAAQLEESQKQLIHLTSEKQTLEKDVANRDRELGTMGRLFSDAMEMMDTLKGQLSQSDSEREVLTQRVSTAQDEISGLHGDLREAKVRLDDTREYLRRAEREKGHLEERMTEARMEITGLRGDVQSANASLETTRDQLQQTEDRAKQAESIADFANARADSMAASTSWKLTAPLRMMSRVFRGGRG